MEIDHLTQEYLRGDRLSNGCEFSIGRRSATGRNLLLQRLAQGRRVLHIGCADHVELIREKRRTGAYLHDLLTASARQVVGVDTSREALDVMRTLGMGDLYHPDDLPESLTFDLVLAPDVIEHVGDVHLFLSGLKRFSAPVVVTTPNALRWNNRIRMRSEFVNTDHRYWFSPYTLLKSLTEAGYEIEDIWYTDELSLRYPVQYVLKQRYPALRDGLAVLARPLPPQAPDVSAR